MECLRVEVDLDKIRHNARTLVARLGSRGISVTGVTKATLGAPEVATALLAAGVSGLADSRVENLDRVRAGGVMAPTLLLRSPAPSQIERAVAVADVSCNTEPEILAALSDAAERMRVTHGVMLMVGDLREGILPVDLACMSELTERLPGLRLVGIGTNLACRSGIVPDDRNMGQLSSLAETVEGRIGRPIDVVSGGNSANLAWALQTADVGRVDDLRLGEAILLGLDPTTRTAIEGLHGDAFTLVAEVIESKRKPSRPWGSTGEAAWGAVTSAVDRGDVWQTILAVGHQDTDPSGLEPPAGVRFLGASSDHLVVETPERMMPGDELRFIPGYGALVRAMTSPFVGVAMIGDGQG